MKMVDLFIAAFFVVGFVLIAIAVGQGNL